MSTQPAVALREDYKVADMALAAWGRKEIKIAETQARDPTRGGRSAGIEALMGHRNFMARLQQAQDLLQSQLQTAELHAQAAQADLLAQELRVAQVRKLQERRTQEDQKQTNRRDQRNSDEASQQRLQHHRAQARELSRETAEHSESGSVHSRY